MRQGECLNPSRKTPKSLKQVATCQLLNARQHVRVSGVLEDDSCPLSQQVPRKGQNLQPHSCNCDVPIRVKQSRMGRNNAKKTVHLGQVAMTQRCKRRQYTKYTILMQLLYVHVLHLLNASKTTLCIKQQIMIIPILFL